MKNKLLKILGIVMTISMLASFMVAGPTAVSAAGSTTTVNTWENLSLPTTNENTNVLLLTQAEDGTIYAAIKYWFFPGLFDVNGTGESGTAILDANTAGTEADVTFTATGEWQWDTGSDFGNGTYPIYLYSAGN
jgi:hypothetical protein